MTGSIVQVASSVAIGVAVGATVWLHVVLCRMARR